jgi:ABC-type dipeptide/oligopeptide/nickel transport system permease subunit
MRVTSVPSHSSLFPSDRSSCTFGANIFNIILAIALLSWPEIARWVRPVLSLRSRQYVDAARVSGPEQQL